jgi:glucose/arabinose dehydrogenase
MLHTPKLSEGLKSAGIFFAGAFFVFISLTSAFAAEHKAVSIYKGNDVVWGFDFLSENEILLTEKNGAVRFIDLKTKGISNVGEAPKTIVNGQGGLMDVKIHETQGKGWVFFTSTVRPEKGDESTRKTNQTTAVFRGVLARTKSGVKITQLTRLFEAEPSVDSGYHFGSRLAFGKNGELFISIGERNERDRAQDLTQHWGKILRLTLDGKPFASNPYIKGEKISGQTPRPEIYSRGHRNPQGLAMHPETHELYASEHGPRGGDEVNLISQGKNYGWPITTHGREYYGPSIGELEKPGIEPALKYFVPSIAPGSLMIYSGKKHPEWKGYFFLGALVLRHLNIVNIKTGAETRLFKDLKLRIRNVVESPAGEIYFSTDSGEIFRIE